MADIGRIARVPLREAWRHEALGLTTWLEHNIDVINDIIGLELTNAEREKAVGDFSVDLTAEDRDGDLVVIENQLGKSDHDHLGKILTYLSNIDAKAAIWIVADPRAEHVKAVSWINESNLAAFYLLKLEAIKIGDSEPAPLLTLISGPSDESRRVGETKKGLSERHVLREKWWTQLLDEAKKRTTLHAKISPGRNNWVGAGAGKSGLAYNYIVLQHGTGIELYIDTGDQDENKRIFDRLCEKKVDIETVFGDDLSWQRLDTKRACRIAKYYEGGGYRDNEDEWPKLQDRLINAMISFHRAISSHLKP
jgi:hypothetical protein